MKITPLVQLAFLLMLSLTACDGKRTAELERLRKEQIVISKEFSSLNKKVFGEIKFYGPRIVFVTTTQPDGSIVAMAPGGGVLADSNKPLFNMTEDDIDGGAVWRLHVKKEGNGWRLKFSEAGAMKRSRKGGFGYEPNLPYWEASRRIYLEKLREAGVTIYADEPSDAEKAKDPVRGFLTLSLSILAHEPP